MTRKRLCRAAERRTAFPATCRCGHPACGEREQLHRTAQFDPLMARRLLAVSFLGMMEAVDQGVYGGIDCSDRLFD